MNQMLCMKKESNKEKLNPNQLLNEREGIVEKESDELAYLVFVSRILGGISCICGYIYGYTKVRPICESQ